MILGHVVDLLVAVLLLATIVWAVRLDRRLKELRDGAGGMRALVGELSQATQRAEAAIAGLKDAARGSGAELARSAAKAEALREELTLLVGAGEGLADRLAARSRAADAPRPAAARPPAVASLRGAR